MFDHDYESPEAAAVRARFEEIEAAYRADHERLLSDEEQRAKELQELQAKHAKAEEEAQKVIEARQQGRADSAEQPPSPWTAPQRETVMSFGDFDEEQSKHDAWSTPTPPMGFPPPPPIPDPVPEAEAFRESAPEPVMRFGSFEDDEPEPPVHQQPPQTPPVSGRRRARDEEDDDDMSGQSWLR